MCTGKPSFMVMVGSSRFEESLKWRKLNAEIIDLGSVKWNVK
jgi:hypothetical protein